LAILGLLISARNLNTGKKLNIYDDYFLLGTVEELVLQQRAILGISGMYGQDFGQKMSKPASLLFLQSANPNGWST
jgi:hypothetical protein